MRPQDVLKILEQLHIRYYEYDLIHVARQRAGMLYRRNARRSSQPGAFDCATFVQYVYAHAGLWLPRYSYLIVDCGDVVEPPYQPGDLLFTTSKNPWKHPAYPKGIGHVAIATSDSTCIHTDNTVSKKVVEIPIKELLWPVTVAKRQLPNVHECGVLLLPDGLLSQFFHPQEIVGYLRKHLQTHHRPRSS